MEDFTRFFYNGHDNCCFCKEFEIETNEGNFNSRVLFENNSAVSFVSAGALVEGHFLIAPKKHWKSVSQLPVEPLNDLLYLLEKTGNWIKSTFGLPVIEFEHGVCSENTGGCGIDHAHIHVMPWPLFSKAMESISLNFSKLPYGDLKELQGNQYYSSYLYFKDFDGESYCFNIKKLPSQYMRKQLSKALCNADWDWRQMPINQNFLRTLQKKAYVGISINE